VILFALTRSPSAHSVPASSIVLGSGAQPLRLALKTFCPGIQRGRLRRRTWPPDVRGRRPLSAPKALTPDGGTREGCCAEGRRLCRRARCAFKLVRTERSE